MRRLPVHTTPSTFSIHRMFIKTRGLTLKARCIKFSAIFRIPRPKKPAPSAPPAVKSRFASAYTASKSFHSRSATAGDGSCGFHDVARRYAMSVLRNGRSGDWRRVVWRCVGAAVGFFRRYQLLIDQKRDLQWTHGSQLCFQGGPYLSITRRTYQRLCKRP